MDEEVHTLHLALESPDGPDLAVGHGRINLTAGYVPGPEATLLDECY